MQKKKKYEGIERRKYPRTEYLNIERPRLKIGKHKFEVLGISQRGLKFLNDKEVKLSKYINNVQKCAHNCFPNKWDPFNNHSVMHISERRYQFTY